MIGITVEIDITVFSVKVGNYFYNSSVSMGLGLEALTGANEVPAESGKPNELEILVIAIDFNDLRGEQRIFERLKPGEVGRALHNGEKVFVKRSEYGGANEVLILRSGTPEQGGHWQTWEIVRADLRYKSPVNEDKLVGLQGDFRTIVEGIQRAPTMKGNSRPSMVEIDPQATLADLIGNHILDNIGNFRTRIRIEYSSTIRIAVDGRLNVGMVDFFTILHKLINRVQSQAGAHQSPSIRLNEDDFEGAYSGIPFRVMDVLVAKLDPRKSSSSQYNGKGYLHVVAIYDYQKNEFRAFEIQYTP